MQKQIVAVSARGTSGSATLVAANRPQRRGGHAPSRDSAQVLGEVAKLVASNADWTLRVEGRTGNAGAKATNQKLSEQRAAASHAA